MSDQLIEEYRVAAIQFEPLLGAKEQNLDRLEALTLEAARGGARLVVQPEMGTTGYCWFDRDEIRSMVEPIPGPTTERFSAIAREHGCYIVVGMPEIAPDTGIFYNSAALLGPRGVIGVYRKTHSYISEPKWAKDGDLGLPVWDTPLGRIGILICADGAYFETARLLALRGADVLCFPTNWLDGPTPAPQWISRAYENGCYLISANRYGLERGVQFAGGSCIIDPDGSIQSMGDTGDRLIYGEVSLERSRSRSFSPGGLPEKLTVRQPDLYDNLTLNTYLYNPHEFHGLYGHRPLPEGKRSRIAVVQMAPVRDDVDANLAAIDKALHALSEAVDLAVFPEYALTGRPNTRDEALDFSLSRYSDRVSELTVLSRRHGCLLVVGMAERIDNQCFSTALLVDEKGEVARYRKAHPIGDERAWCLAGTSRPPVVDLPLGRLGLLIGSDLCFPEAARSLAVAGCDLLAVPAGPGLPPAWPVPPAGRPAAYHLARERADENNCYVAFASLPAPDGIGQSGIFGPAQRFMSDEQIIDATNGLVTREIDTTNLDTRFPTCEVRAKDALRRRQTQLYDLLQYPEPAANLTFAAATKSSERA